jgi:hypothetical protein
MSQTKPLINQIHSFLSSNISSNSLPNYFSSQNTTNKILGISDTFTGYFEEVINYSNLVLNIKSDVYSEINGVIIEFGNLINIVEFKYEYTYKTSEIFLIQIPISTKYFRIKYINGKSAQTYFNLFTMVVSGSKISYGSDGLLDAFGRLRVSDIKTLMDITHTFDNDTIMEDEKITNPLSTMPIPTSIHNLNESCQITTINSSQQKIIRQSRKYCIYQPGKSLLIKFTCILNANPGGNEYYTSSSVGYFDDSNGYFFKYSEKSLKIVYRSKITGKVIDEDVPQSKWNLNTLSSLTNGYIINPSRVQIYFMDLQWLGVGRVRLGIVHNGNYIFCHEFLHDNILDKVYITNANLPIRHELIALIPQPPTIPPKTNKAQCKLICATVISEGGYDPIGITFSASCNLTAIQVSNIEVPILSIRLKNIRNRTMVIPTNINLYNDGSSLSIYYVRLFRAPINPLTGDLWLGVVHSNSAIEYDIDATGLVITNAITVAQGYFIGKSDFQINTSDIFNGFLQLTSNIDGQSDILVISSSSTGINQKTYASIQWKEVF